MNKTMQGQNILDVILQQSGDFATVVRDAAANDLSLTADLEIGTEVQATPGNPLRYRNRPATALLQAVKAAPVLKGIGYMEIGTTFRVS
ncbi:hypothetical protein [Chryseobacterium sp. MFBS3-17]|uniref:hypothetical protein n=1 Tax=Chryseobacterium sp. MFBS3-17 TaxID=2886689 RepID=UPI001D0E86CB|nr:hypothetical protein [Chryseobacterium sp. MFBS3-17]MCC2590367.1 hypothetical protein [Chryseobacterium sp. MFBS3-17]